MPAPMAIVPSATRRVMRLPYITRENTSRPILSVPMMWAGEMPWSRSGPIAVGS